MRTTSSSAPALPPELIARICAPPDDYTIEGRHGDDFIQPWTDWRAVIVGAAGVNRAWNAVAAPLLRRHIVVTTMSGLRKVFARMLAPDAADEVVTAAIGDIVWRDGLERGLLSELLGVLWRILPQLEAVIVYDIIGMSIFPPSLRRLVVHEPAAAELISALPLVRELDELQIGGLAEDETMTWEDGATMFDIVGGLGNLRRAVLIGCALHCEGLRGLLASSPRLTDLTLGLSGVGVRRMFVGGEGGEDADPLPAGSFAALRRLRIVGVSYFDQVAPFAWLPANLDELAVRFDMRARFQDGGVIPALNALTARMNDLTLARPWRDLELAVPIFAPEERDEVAAALQDLDESMARRAETAGSPAGYLDTSIYQGDPRTWEQIETGPGEAL